MARVKQCRLIQLGTCAAPLRVASKRAMSMLAAAAPLTRLTGIHLGSFVRAAASMLMARLEATLSLSLIHISEPTRPY